MYEPVVENCVTILSPKLVNQKKFEQHEPDEDIVRTDGSDVVPEKPPRRNKFKKLKTQDSLEYQRYNIGNYNMQSNGDNCIDIDHINLETERNYKNKFITIGIQTSPIVPYRLRIWPRKSTIATCHSEEKSPKKALRGCCKILSQWFLSQIGLTIILIFWALLGAAGFYKTEGKVI